MSLGQKFVILASASLALMVTAWAAYFLGFSQGTKSGKTATESGQLVATGSGDFILAAQDDLFNQQNDDGTGVATGTVKTLTQETITLTNAKGDQTAAFKIDSATVYLKVKDKKLTREGGLADLSVGMLVQISFKGGDQQLAQTIIR